MSLLRPPNPISAVYNSLKINRHFGGNFGKKDFSEGTQRCIFSRKMRTEDKIAVFI